MNDFLIEARGLTKVYGKGESAFEALKGVDLTVTKGESLAIVGKSGSGKSTLMHLLALMDKPTSGTIRIEGKEVNELNRRELDRLRNEKLGFIFQQFFLNARDSVLENVVLPLKIAGVSPKEREERGMAALGSVGLSDKARNRANDLSGGQKQRVVIARALVNDGSIIMADEPSGNLDSTTGEIIEDILFGLNRDKGITLIVVTHDQEFAKKCGRQVNVKDGRIVESLES